MPREKPTNNPLQAIIMTMQMPESDTKVKECMHLQKFLDEQLRGEDHTYDIYQKARLLVTSMFLDQMRMVPKSELSIQQIFLSNLQHSHQPVGYLSRVLALIDHDRKLPDELTGALKYNDNKSKNIIESALSMWCEYDPKVLDQVENSTENKRIFTSKMPSVPDTNTDFFTDDVLDKIADVVIDSNVNMRERSLLLEWAIARVSDEHLTTLGESIKGSLEMSLDTDRDALKQSLAQFKLKNATCPPKISAMINDCVNYKENFQEKKFNKK